MAKAAKYFNPDTEQWEYVQQGPKGEDSTVPGPTGSTGPSGPSGPAGPTGPAGSGNVNGAANSVDNEIVLFNSTTGKVIKKSRLLATLANNRVNLTPEDTTVGLGLYANNGSFVSVEDLPGMGNINMYIQTPDSADPGDYALLSIAGNDYMGNQYIDGKMPFRGGVQHVVDSAADGDIWAAFSYAQLYERTALSADIQVYGPWDNAQPGSSMTFLFEDNGTSRTITWDSIYEGINTKLPLKTTPGRLMAMRAIYSEVNDVWYVYDLTGADSDNSPRVTSITSNATPTFNTDYCDALNISALATDITNMTTNLSGSPKDFDKLTIRIKDNGSARTISWGGSFVSAGATLPTTTVAGKLLHVGFIFNANDNNWKCVALSQEA